MTQAVQTAQFGNTNPAWRNRIINGGMTIDQRNAGASITGNDTTFGVDRWANGASQSSKFTVQQNAGSVTPPVGFKNYLGVTSSSAYSVGANDYFFLTQKIEGLNVSDLAWGSVSAATVTLSFWVRSSLTGTFGGALRNSGGTRTYPFSYTISSAGTWEQKTVTIAGDTTGTWLTTNGIGIEVDFSLGMGSTFSGTAGSWSSSNYVSVTGATSVVGTNGATFYITGVQLEVGTAATNFEFRDYGRELIMCQRYYETNYPVGSNVGSSASGTFGASGGDFPIGSYARYRPYFCVQKRAAPTVNVWDNAGNSGKCFANGASNQAVSLSTTQTSGYQFATSSTLSSSTEVTFAWAASAEL